MRLTLIFSSCPEKEPERHVSDLPRVLPELTELSWWRRGPDAENLCQRCLCSSDSMCPAYRFPSAPPQLISVSGVLSLHFPHPPAEPRLALLASSRLQTDLFANITDDLIAQTLHPVLSACSQVHHFTLETNRMISVLVNHTVSLIKPAFLKGPVCSDWSEMLEMSCSFPYCSMYTLINVWLLWCW